MFFGTDGIRGIVDKELTYELAYKLGNAVGRYIYNHGLTKKVIIGCDTRISGDMFTCAIACGLTNIGIDVTNLGIVSTPSISYLSSKFDVGIGIMVTASHNDSTYNGIKCFTCTGEKLGKDAESEIENYMVHKFKTRKRKGKVVYNDNLINYYINALSNSFKIDLSNKTIVLDCANGANYYIAPKILKSLGANVIKIACTNDGSKINKNCGAGNTKKLKQEVLLHHADFGIAFDGDGDRLAIVLSDGTYLNGDMLLYIFSKHLMGLNQLNSMSVVGTIMSNIGLEKSLNKIGIKLYRTDVGDKNVIELLKTHHLVLGGESSGHICFFENNRTCDALYSALYLLNIVCSEKINLTHILSELVLFPSITKNIKINETDRKNYNSLKDLHNNINLIVNKYPQSRIVVRPSGTENVIRLHVQSEKETINENIINELLLIFNKYIKKNA